VGEVSPVPCATADWSCGSARRPAAHPHQQAAAAGTAGGLQLEVFKSEAEATEAAHPHQQAAAAGTAGGLQIQVFKSEAEATEAAHPHQQAAAAGTAGGGL